MNTWMNTDPYANIKIGDTGTPSGELFDTKTISGLYGNGNINTSNLDFLNSTGTITPSYGVDQMNTWMNTDPYANIKIGDTGTPSGELFDTKTISGLYGNGNINTSNLDFLNSTGTITPSYGSDVSITGDIAKNISNSMNIPNGVIGSTLNQTETPVNNYGLGTAESDIFKSPIKTTPDLTDRTITRNNNPAQIDSNIIANAIRNSPLNQNQYSPDAMINNATNNLPPPSNTVTPTGGTNTNTTTFSPTKTYDELTMTPYNISSGLPEGYKTADIGLTGGALSTITPEAIPDYNLRTTPFTDMGTLTTNANVSTGDLPQFRKQLNRALADANNAAIMTGRPISRSTISGVVEGLASGASDRMNAANQLALENRQIESSELQQARGLISQEQQQAEQLGFSKWETQSQLAQNLAIQQAQLQESQRQFNSEMAENQRQFDNGEINKFEYQRREQELQKWQAENEFALDNQKLQLLQDQAATAKDQWERGFITEKEYNDRVLALQEKYAELGYKADADFLKKSEKNQDWGNIIGTLSLLDDLWG
jgi:hypothetical protein